MGKKFSIAKALDIRELNIQIDHYLHAYDEKDSYLFMSDETLNEFGVECVKQFGAKTLDDLDFNKVGYVSNYCGYKVFCNNDLAFEEVEIR